MFSFPLLLTLAESSQLSIKFIAFSLQGAVRLREYKLIVTSALSKFTCLSFESWNSSSSARFCVFLREFSARSSRSSLWICSLSSRTFLWCFSASFFDSCIEALAS